jgi:hypothetical protein
MFRRALNIIIRLVAVAESLLVFFFFSWLSGVVVVVFHHFYSFLFRFFASSPLFALCLVSSDIHSFDCVISARRTNLESERALQHINRCFGFDGETKKVRAASKLYGSTKWQQNQKK